MDTVRFLILIASFVLPTLSTLVKDHHGCIEGELDPKLRTQCPGGFLWNCHKARLRNITHFPESDNTSKLCAVDLRHNELQKVYNFTFVNLTDLIWLWLGDNKIDYIESDSFVGLGTLQWLDLRRNPFFYPASFGDRVFDPLSNLQAINIKSNQYQPHSYCGLVDLLKPLRRLQYLAVSGFSDCMFEEGFENLTSLTRLTLSGGNGTKSRHEEVCDITVLVNNTFRHLPHIQRLSVSACNISQVETGAFANLKDLNYLDISYNHDLTFHGLPNVLISLKNTSVEVLNVNFIHPPFERGTVLTKESIEPIKYLTNLTNLYMDLNKIELIDEKVFSLIPNSVYVLTLAANRLTYGKYTRSIESMKHIGYLDISRQHLNYDPFRRNHDPYASSSIVHMHVDESQNSYQEQRCDETSHELHQNDFQPTPEMDFSQSGIDDGDIAYHKPATTATNNYGDTSPNCTACIFGCMVDKSFGGCFCPPPNIKTLKWRKSFLNFNLYKFRVCLSPPIETLDISYNLIYEWIGPIYGLEHLKNLDMTANFCDTLSYDFFDTMPNLRNLSVSQNLLGQVLHPTANNSGEHFNALTKLETLNLSENRITALPSNMFELLEHLKYLNLSTNMISQWNITIKSKYLTVLDLSKNKIEFLSESARQNLDNIAKAKDEGINENLTVYLGGNDIQCNCDNRPFLEWLSESPVHFKFDPTDECHMQNGQRIPLDNPKVAFPRIVSQLNVECIPYGFIAASICIFVITIVSCLVLYRLRWKLRHIYYKRYRRHKTRGYDRLFETDAFVSYASTEGSFIKNKLAPAVETDNTAIKLWIADRDSQAGASVAENLTHAIYHSKKTVIILSRNYLKENWCNFEMNMARLESVESKRKLFIIVLYEDISPEELPLDYLRLLRSEVSVEYPTHPQDLDTFWMSLIQAINDE